jgi:hypothetical protein
MSESLPDAFRDVPVLIQGQRTIWDELVDQSLEAPPGQRRLVAGMMSHLGLCDDNTLVRVGRVARREASGATKRHREATAATWMALLGACTDEWLSRHPRP